MLGFGKRKRQIFRYHDGQRKRAADPIAVLRDMSSHPKLDLAEHFQHFESEDPKLRNEAGTVLVESTREIFGIKSFSERCPNGLTELETLDVLYAFIEYTETLKKNGNGPPT